MMILSLWLYSVSCSYMFVMIAIKPCDTSMPKATLVCDDMMVGMDVSHGSMSIMNSFCWEDFSRCKFKIKWNETYLRQNTSSMFSIELIKSNMTLTIIWQMFFFCKSWAPDPSSRRGPPPPGHLCHPPQFAGCIARWRIQDSSFCTTCSYIM